MTVTYDVTTEIGKVRLYSRDTEGKFHSDEEIGVFLDDADDRDPRLAAALALEDIASNQTLLLKLISIAGISTNGPAVAEDLRKAADRLRMAVMGFDTGEGLWDIAENAGSIFAYREKLMKDALNRA